MVAVGWQSYYGDIFQTVDTTSRLQTLMSFLQDLNVLGFRNVEMNNCHLLSTYRTHVMATTDKE